VLESKSSTRHSDSIQVLERDEPSQKRERVCRDEIDIEYRPHVLSAFFFQKPSGKIVDLIRIAACIAHADRRITRWASNWGRDIELSIPVAESGFWNHTAAAPLQRLLNLLTGDRWNFVFRASKQPSVPQFGEFLNFPPQQEPVIAYSDGLDSFAVGRLAAAGVFPLGDNIAGRRDLVLVTTGKKIRADRKKRPSEFGSTRRISVPFKIRRLGEGFQLRESSYRSRAFVFQTLAAIAAFQSESDLVVVAEAGQGSIGPWLTVTGDESADVRTHPLFTSALSDFLMQVLGRRIRFVHPALWKTKGEVLRTLVNNRLERNWERTFSCAVQVRHLATKGKRLHCGICPNCVLRRQSLTAAGLGADAASYSFDTEVSLNPEQLTLKQKKKIAQGLFPLIELANVDSSNFSVEKKIREYAGMTKHSLDQYVSLTKALLDSHSQELEQFLKSLDARSPIRVFGEAWL
jgi:7-cyano-7-deazaguanine synthase in queuosine biosynthesis